MGSFLVVRRTTYWRSVRRCLRIVMVAMMASICVVAGADRTRVVNDSVFAPALGIVKPQEKTYRNEICLNGRWQFQPVAVPADYHRNTGTPPNLPPPSVDKWDPTPIKIPSPWNVNGWGTGHATGIATAPYEPGSNYFPSYPTTWTSVEMGWLRRSFRLTSSWKKQRILVYFQAVAGECQVLINGKMVGKHFDSWLPFSLDITRFVKWDGPNELLVGVRSHALFDIQSEKHPRMVQPYPEGSTTSRLAGIWQDTFLVGIPMVSIQDLFVKPSLGTDTLSIDVTLVNKTKLNQTFQVGGKIVINLPGTPAEAADAAVPTWKLGGSVLNVKPRSVVLPAGRTLVLPLSVRVNGKLKLWTPTSPNLYSAAINISSGKSVIDQKLQRFGWRQFKLRGKDLLLNGRPLQLVGDMLHPFGPFVLSRRYAYAWYRSVQEFGGNAVRLHGQIHPVQYLDLADEMGIVVLDESSIFGSSLSLNLDEPVTWTRFAEHFDGLVQRDRNHPSIVGWSVANEMDALIVQSGVAAEDADRWYHQLTDLAMRAKRLDPTRMWISCDGDEDLHGTLPVWSKHFGIGVPLNQIPAIDKPRMVGESGGSYYAGPALIAPIIGNRAYVSSTGRNEGLAVDLYDNITLVARPKLTYFSASETAWFGLEHLPFGYREFDRLPDDQDGIFFNHVFEEGVPGIQLEHLPPYVCTLNPGWDTELPLYKPLPMFEAEKAALTLPNALPIPWKRVAVTATQNFNAPAPQFNRVALIGDSKGDLARRLSGLGVVFETAATASHSGCTVIDGDTLSRIGAIQAVESMQRLSQGGGTEIVMLGEGKSLISTLDAILPGNVRLTQRKSTSLLVDAKNALIYGLHPSDLDFSSDGTNRLIQSYGISGSIVDHLHPVLRASDTDWSLFLNVPEVSGPAAIELYEQLHKPAGGSLFDVPFGKGRLILCSIDYRILSSKADVLWRRLLSGSGINLAPPQDGPETAFEGGVLLRAMAIGRFGAESAAAAISHDFLGKALLEPASGAQGLQWKQVVSASRDRFQFSELGQGGPESGACVYFSFWLKSPKALAGAPDGAPDAPSVDLLCYAADLCKLYLNGKEIVPNRTGAADYRKLYSFDQMPLIRDWNRIIIKVATDHVRGSNQGSMAVRMFSNEPDFLNDLVTSPTGH